MIALEGALWMSMILTVICSSFNLTTKIQQKQQQLQRNFDEQANRLTGDPRAK